MQNGWLGRLLLVLMIVGGSAVGAVAESIRVVVVDAETKEPLPGAGVQIEGTYVGDATNGEGKCEIRNQKPGTYVLLVQYVSYVTRRVEGVVVRPSAGVDVKVELEPETISLDAVRVEARANRESEKVLIMEQREAVVPSISLGAQEMSRKGIGDAQAAVSKVSGVSKQEGMKNVFVRGLGDRYNITLLNGFPIPSEDPEYKNISLDFFSSDVMQNVSVSKVFTGRQNGNVAGAIVDVSSKELFDQYSFGVSASVGANRSLMLDRFVRQDGVGYFGFAGTAHPERIDNKTFRFGNMLVPRGVAVPLNHSYGISGGYRWEFGEGRKHSFAFYAVGAHNSHYGYSKTEVRSAVFDETSGAKETQNQEGEKFSIGAQQIALANVTLRLFKRYQIAYNLLYVHSSDQYVSELSGFHSERYADVDEHGSVGFLRRQQVNDNRLLTNQLLTMWELIPKLNLTVGASYNMVRGNEPDRRESNLSYWGDGVYNETKGDSQRRFFSKLTGSDLNINAAISYILPDRTESGKSKVEVGYTGRLLAQTDFAGNNYALIFRNYPLSGEFKEYPFDLQYQNGMPGALLAKAIKEESYHVGKAIHGAYVDASYQLGSKFNLSVGCRYDNVVMAVDYVTLVDGSGKNTLRNDFWLPSLNLRYDPTEAHTLRLGVSKSYTIPQDKEISPFEYINIGFTSKGNPELKPARSYNIDLRWDYTFNSADYVALTGYYKRILDPISRINIPGSGNKLGYDNVSDVADVAGGELEVRATPMSIVAGKARHELLIGLNAAYIYTTQRILTANMDRRSSMEGAAPLVGNADLTYRVTLPNVQISTALVGGYFFDRIYTIGMWGYADIIESGRPELDLVFSAKFWKSLSISFKARNLINPAVKLTRQFAGEREPFVLERGYKGRSFSLGVSYSLNPR